MLNMMYDGLPITYGVAHDGLSVDYVVRDGYL